MITNIYDSRGWLARSLNPLQQATLYTNDQAGRLFTVTDPLLRTVSFAYDADGRRIATTNAALEATRRSWSPRSELIKLTNPATNIVSRDYDSTGNQIADDHQLVRCAGTIDQPDRSGRLDGFWFLNPDPAGFSGGLNFYAYGDGNPISLVDPFGLSLWSALSEAANTLWDAAKTTAGALGKAAAAVWGATTTTADALGRAGEAIYE